MGMASVFSYWAQKRDLIYEIIAITPTKTFDQLKLLNVAQLTELKNNLNKDTILNNGGDNG